MNYIESDSIENKSWRDKLLEFEDYGIVTCCILAALIILFLADIVCKNNIKEKCPLYTNKQIIQKDYTRNILLFENQDYVKVSKELDFETLLTRKNLNLIKFYYQNDKGTIEELIKKADKATLK